MTKQSKAIRINAKFAQKTWGKLPQIACSVATNPEAIR
jgi:hypothetical protein